MLKRAAPFTSVLCPIDFSEYSAAALRYAAAVIKRTGGRLHCLYVNDPLLVTTAAIALGDRRLAATSRAELRKFVAASLPAGAAPAAAIRCYVDLGKPGRTIVAAARRLRCDLIVMGTHGLSGVDKVLVGSTTEWLLRCAAIPVLAIPPALEAIGANAPAREWPGPTIMAPIALGKESVRDAGDTAALARLFEADLLLLHVVPQLKPPPWYRPDTSAQDQIRVEKTRRQLAAVASTSPDDVRCDSRVRSGTVPEEIALAAAVEQVGLVVMHLRKGAGVFGSRAGSITYHVLRHAMTPVLALPDRSRA